MKISLIGFIGVGKTQIGKALSAALNLPFFDIDANLEASEGMPVSDIMAKKGTEGFRQMELQALKDHTDSSADSVISTGGGTLMHPPSRLIIKQNTYPVWLKADPETIWKRLRNKPHVAPLFYTHADPLMAIRSEIMKRERHYQEVARLTVSVDGKIPEVIAGEIKEVIEHDLSK